MPEKIEHSREHENLFDLYKNRGRIDISEYNKEELDELFREYKNRFNELDETAQTEMFEQFLLTGACTEEEAGAVIELLSDTQKKVIGEFIGKVIEPGRYVKAFHATWRYLDDVRLWEEFKNKFTVEHPRAVIMVAPFIDLSCITVEDPESESKRNILGVYGNNFEAAKAILEASLEAYRGDDFDYGFKSVIDFYKETYPYVLFPYLTRLVDLLLISREEAKKLFMGENANGRTIFFNKRFYLNQKEKEKEKKLIEKERHIFKDDQKASSDFYTVVGDRAWGLLKEQGILEAHAMERALRHMFHDSDMWLSWFSDEERSALLRNYIECSIPIYRIVRELHLKDNEIRELMADNMALMDVSWVNDLSDLKTLIDMNMEPRALQWLTFLIRQDGLNSLLVRDFMLNLENILPLFSSVNQKRIINTLNTHHPEAWLRRLDYVVEYEPLPLKNIFAKTGNHERLFLSRYRSVMHYVGLMEKEGKEIGIDRGELRAIARRIMDRERELTLVFYDVFRDIYTKEEADVFIKDSIVNDEGGRFLNEIAYLWKVDAGGKGICDPRKYKNEIRDVIEKNPIQSLDAICNVRGSWDMLIELFPSRERFRLLVDNIASFDFLYFIDTSNEEFLLDALENPRLLNSCIDAIIKLEDGAILGSFLEKIVHFIGSHKYTRQESKAHKEKDAGDMWKKRMLFPSAFQTASLAKNRLLEAFRNICRDKKFAVFESDMARSGDIDLSEFIERDIAAYARLFPDIMSHEEALILPHEKYEEIIESRLRSFVFLKGRHGKELYSKEAISLSIKEKMNAMNPFSGVEGKERIEDDYYKVVLRGVEGNPFFPLYEKQLKKIAAEELKKYGPRRQIEYFTPHKKFEELVRRIGLLGSSDRVCERRAEIMALPIHEREILIDALQVVLIHSIDVDEKEFFNEALNDIGERISQAQEKLWALITHYFGDVFEIEGMHGGGSLKSQALFALGTYYRKSCKGNRFMKEKIKEVVSVVFRGNYNKWRAWGKEGVLEDIEKSMRCEAMIEEGILPRSLTRKLYDIWIEASSVEFDDVLDIKEGDIRVGIRAVIDQAIADQHIKNEELGLDRDVVTSEYETIFAPIKDIQKELQELQKMPRENLRDEERRRLRELQEELRHYRDASNERIKNIEARLYLLCLKSITKEELSRKSIKVGREDVAFTKVLRTLRGAYTTTHPEFLHDIQKLETILYESFQKMFGGGGVSRSNLIITDKIDFETYLKIGEEPVESCQSYDSGGGLNVGLLSYISDPNVKIIQIYNESNTIISRAVLRLLEDKEGSPVLFLERIYSVNLHEKITSAIKKFAKRKAQSMGIELYSHSAEGYEEGVENESVDIYSRGSRSPYVYTDAGGGKMRNGIYVIRNAARIG